MSTKIHVRLMCCCVVCKKEYSYKGINSHYSINHVSGNKENHQQRSAKASVLGGESTKQKFDDQASMYDASPNHCKQCSQPLTYSKRHNLYCSTSCSASATNLGMKRTDETKQLISSKLSEYCLNRPKSSRVRFKQCSECNVSYTLYQGSSATEKFCSKGCLNIHRSRQARSNPGLGTKRSKDEVELFNMISASISNVIPNHIIHDGWDADIAIPDIKVAIFWNGPWHYKDMNIGNHSLAQVQNRDRIKTKLFKSLGWTVLVYEDRHYTPSTAYDHAMKAISTVHPYG